MKTLYLNRHAKSSWSNPSLDDFDRPLNKRGKRDAPFMGDILRKKVLPPDIIYSSPAKRAISTAFEIAEAFKYDKEEIQQKQIIYDAVVSDIIRIINNTSDDYDIIMMFGHNPTFTLASNYLTNKFIDNIPTSGFVQIDFDLDSWREVDGDTGKLVLFEYPKKYLT
jgi:phosphohistidine phosphatase